MTLGDDFLPRHALVQNCIFANVPENHDILRDLFIAQAQFHTTPEKDNNNMDNKDNDNATTATITTTRHNTKDSCSNSKISVDGTAPIAAVFGNLRERSNQRHCPPQRPPLAVLPRHL